MSAAVRRVKEPYSHASPSGFALLLTMLRAPLETWSGRRRLTVATLIAAAVLGIGAYGWDVTDLGSASASRVALADVEHRVSAARTAIAELPLLRAGMARAKGVSDDRVGSPLGNWHAISELAAQSGLRLQAMEPAPARGEGIQAVRPIRVVARANFADLFEFLRGLPSLPVLVVPSDLQLKRDGGELVINMTLEVFDALPSPLAESSAAGDSVGNPDSEHDEPWEFDPFSIERGAVTTPESALHLVGVLREGRRGIALLATEEGAMALEMGQRIGGESLTGIEERRILLSSDAGTRVLTVAEASR